MINIVQINCIYTFIKNQQTFLKQI